MKRFLIPLLAALVLPTYVNANYLCTIDEVVWGKSRKLKEYEQFNIIAFTSTDRLDEDGKKMKGYIYILDENKNKYKYKGYMNDDDRFFYSRTYEYENNPFEIIYEIGDFDGSGGEFKRTVKNLKYKPGSNFYDEKTAKAVLSNSPEWRTGLVHKGTCKKRTYDLDKKIYYWSEIIGNESDSDSDSLSESDLELLKMLGEGLKNSDWFKN